MSNYDIVIKGGTVFDGLQTPRFKADIAVKDGRIAHIGNVDASEGAEVVDAVRASTSHPGLSTCTPTTTARSFGIRGAPCPAGTV